MTTVAELSAKNAHNIAVENNKRGAAIVRVCGEEHAAISNGNAATFFLAHDNDMCFISDYKFKIILGTGGTGTNPNNPIPANVPRGTRLYSSIDAFIAQFPVGTAIDADGVHGAQSLVPWSCLMESDGRYQRVDSLYAGDKIKDKTGKNTNTISDNDTTEEQLVEVRTESGYIVGTTGHRMFVGGKQVELSKLKHGNIIDTPPVNGVELDLADDQYKCLGLWLGDGDISYKTQKNGTVSINSIRITVGTKAKEAYLLSLGVDISWHMHSNGKAKVASIMSTKRNRPLRKAIIKYHDKRIPVLASGAKEVIEGFLVADGTWKRESQNVVTNTNRPLLCAIKDMCISLGYKAVLSKEKIRKSTNFCSTQKPISRLSINFNCKKKFTPGRVLSVKPAGKGVVYHTNVKDVNHSYIAEGLCSHNCVDYASAFWLGMCNRFVDCGENNAKGIWLNSWAVNKGTEFDSISSWANLQKGDWIVWNTGTYGHIAMAAGAPSGNSIQVYNQNVSGIPWPDGGRAVSLDTRSNSGFLGAFRFKW